MRTTSKQYGLQPTIKPNSSFPETKKNDVKEQESESKTEYTPLTALNWHRGGDFSTNLPANLLNSTYDIRENYGNLLCSFLT